MQRDWKLSLPYLTTTKKLNKQKIDDFSLTHQRTEVTGQTTIQNLASQVSLQSNELVGGPKL